MEQVGADAARARVGEQHAAGREDGQRQPVDVFIGARGPLGVRDSRRELGRVEHDGVEGPALLYIVAQRCIHVGVEHRGAAGVKTVQGDVGPGALNGRAGRVNRRDVLRAAGQRRHRETAGVAVAVQHVLEFQPARVGGKLLAAVALVEVKAGLVAFGNVQAQLPVVLGDGDGGVARAGEPAGGFGQAFERAHAGVGALVHALQAGLRQECLDDHAFPFLRAAA